MPFWQKKALRVVVEVVIFCDLWPNEAMRAVGESEKIVVFVQTVGPFWD